MEWVETTARTVEEAKELALDQLGVVADEAEFEVLAEPKPGLFGRVARRGTGAGPGPPGAGAPQAGRRRGRAAAPSPTARRRTRPRQQLSRPPTDDEAATPDAARRRGGAWP